MKTDIQVQKDVMAELEWEPRVDHANIGVAAKDSVVTLSGFVSNYASKLAAEKATRRVNGVHGIAEEIEVRFATDTKTTDPEIAKRIADMFDWSVTIPNGKISVKVEHGWVMLSGDTVKLYGKFHSGYERRIAERTAWAAPGVNRLEDNIMII